MTTVPRQASALRAAELYYLENQTMDAISQILGCSRATVSRLVSEAKSAGLVEIIVHRKGRAAAMLERLIGERYGVSVTVVAPPPDATESDRLRHVAAQGAALLRTQLAPDLTLGVLWGVTSVGAGAQPVAGCGAGDAGRPDRRGGQHLLRRRGIRVGHAWRASEPHWVRGCTTSLYPRSLTPRRRARWCGPRQSVQRVLRLQQRANLAVFSVSALGGRVPGHLYRAGYLQRDDAAVAGQSGCRRRTRHGVSAGRRHQQLDRIERPRQRTAHTTPCG